MYWISESVARDGCCVFWLVDVGGIPPVLAVVQVRFFWFEFDKFDKSFVHTAYFALAELFGVNYLANVESERNHISYGIKTTRASSIGFAEGNIAS